MIAPVVAGTSHTFVTAVPARTHAAPACRPCRWPWPRRSPRPAPPAARTPRLGSPAAPASPDRLLPHRGPDTRAARGPRSGTESLNRVLQAQCATRQGQGPGARLTRRPQRPETHRRRRATRPDFHARTASPAGTWRLTGKQTDFARYELVFTPARRPRRDTSTEPKTAWSRRSAGCPCFLDYRLHRRADPDSLADK